MSIKIAVSFLQHLLNSVGRNLLEFGEAFGRLHMYCQDRPLICLGELLICFSSNLQIILD